jgi:hypothetical protein
MALVFLLTLLGGAPAKSAEMKLSPQAVEVFPGTDFFVDILANAAGSEVVVAEVRFRVSPQSGMVGLTRIEPEAGVFPLPVRSDSPAPGDWRFVVASPTPGLLSGSDILVARCWFHAESTGTATIELVPAAAPGPGCRLIENDCMGTALPLSLTNASISVIDNDGSTRIDFFSAHPSAFNLGDSVVLFWGTTNSTDTRLDQGIGSVPEDGSLSVEPVGGTIYTLTASGNGTDSAQITLSALGAVTLKIAKDSDAAHLFWTEVPGAARYLVSRGTENLCLFSFCSLTQLEMTDADSAYAPILFYQVRTLP